jgi:uncharacterized protein (TIGR00730 family)
LARRTARAAEAAVLLDLGGGQARQALWVRNDTRRTLPAGVVSVLEAGGRVTGIIPDFLEKRELMLREAQDLIIVPDMHTRKRLMFERADAFVALPGGVGTLEELVEQLTWVQLGRHRKPVLMADVGGFWRPLLSLLAHMRENGFIRQDTEVRYLVSEKIEDIVPMLKKAIEIAAREGADTPALDNRL